MEENVEIERMPSYVPGSHSLPFLSPFPFNVFFLFLFSRDQEKRGTRKPAEINHMRQRRVYPHLLSPSPPIIFTHFRSTGITRTPPPCIRCGLLHLPPLLCLIEAFHGTITITTRRLGRAFHIAFSTLPATGVAYEDDGLYNAPFVPPRLPPSPSLDETAACLVYHLLRRPPHLPSVSSLL